MLIRNVFGIILIKLSSCDKKIIKNVPSICSFEVIYICCLYSRLCVFKMESIIVPPRNFPLISLEESLILKLGFFLCQKMTNESLTFSQFTGLLF